MKDNGFIRLVKEQPLLLVTLVLCVVLFIFIILVGGNSSNEKATTGDLAPAGSSAYLVYNKSVYLPMKSKIASNLVRADVAYFGRSTIEVYKSGKETAVIFNVQNVSNSNENEVIFTGTFKESKDTVSVTSTLLKNDRVQIKILNQQSGVSMDEELPSQTAENSLIGSLPLVGLNYRVDYVEFDGSLNVTIGEKNPAYIDEANLAIQKKLGKSDMSLLKIAYIYPTDVDYGSALEPVSPRDGDGEDEGNTIE